MSLSEAGARRLSRYLLICALGVLTLGFFAIGLAARPGDGAELRLALSWYVVHQLQSPLLLPLLIATAMATTALFVVMLPAQRAFRRAKQRGALPEQTSSAFEPQDVAREARGMLEPWLSESTDPTRLADALFGTLVDIGGSRLRLVGGSPRVAIELSAAMERHRVGELSQASYRRLLDHLRELLGLARDGAGWIEFHGRPDASEGLRIAIDSDEQSATVLIESSRLRPFAWPLTEQGLPAARLTPLAAALSHNKGVVVLAGADLDLMVLGYAIAHHFHATRPGSRIVSLERDVPLALPYVDQHVVGRADPGRVCRSLIDRGPDLMLMRGIGGDSLLRELDDCAKKRLVVFCMRGRLERTARRASAHFTNLSAFIWRRSLRRLCDRCRTTVAAPALSDEFARRGVTVSAWYEAQGCQACRGRGFHGFTAIYANAADSEDASDLYRQCAVLLEQGVVSAAEVKSALGELR
ncbi:MAG: hypothetical protein H6707_10640 [Deltaproteobacteria bacterium]|nr:hypothetical protein [Deltaproteobacteria bacterium]